MIDRTIKFFLENPFVVLVLVAAAVAGGVHAVRTVPVDAIPDIGENQTIVFTEWMGRSPRDVYDQVTYPLSTELQGIPGVKTIRGMSGFGFSVIYVIFEDGVDFYWARTRVAERLDTASRVLPQGVSPSLGPDATAMGQIFWYTVENGYFCDSHPGRFASPEEHHAAHPGCDAASLHWSGKDLQELRALQDWVVRFPLNAVDGVSEVASVGGYVKQYQIDLAPERMRARGVTQKQVEQAVRRSNLDVGAKVVQEQGLEFIVRGVGFIRDKSDVETIVVKRDRDTPVFVRDVASVALGPDFRRGALDKEGAETVGGVVVMRYGGNPQKVIEGVKARIETIEPSLPPGVRIVPFYDRTGLVEETMGTLKIALVEEIIITVAVILLFLLHLRSSLVVAATLPLAVLLAFVAMRVFSVDANIMSLAGIAIAIGTMVDMGIIMTENIYSRLAESKEGEDRGAVVFEAASEVGSAILTAISTTVISFLPVFMLTDQEGKLFTPLAWTKTFALFGSVIVAIVVVPVLSRYLLRTVTWSRRRAALFSLALGAAAFAGVAVALPRFAGGLPSPWLAGLISGLVVAAFAYRAVRERLKPLEQNPVSRFITRTYEPVLRFFLARKARFLLVPLSITLLGLTIWLGAGATFPYVLALAAGLAAAWAFSSVHRRFSRGGGALEGRVRLAGMLAAAAAAMGGVALSGADEFLTDRVPVYASAKRDVFPGIGREFMPPLDEGSFLYMPSLLPSASLDEVQEAMSKQDRLMKQVPEVDVVVGKLGRVDSALDPAPLGMIETVIMLKPESAWREVGVDRWFSSWPGWLKAPLALIWPERRRITKDEILQNLRMRTDMIGVAPSWLQPIETRVVMLQSGFKGQMGVKVFGDDLAEIERIGLKLEEIVKAVPGAVDVVADRIVGKPYVEFHVDREAAARYGVLVEDVQNVVETALGGKNLTFTVEGESRFPVRIRYTPDRRDGLGELPRILVPTPAGPQVPIAHVADMRFSVGPGMIRSENVKKVGYVTFNARGRDEISVAEDVAAAIRANWAKITSKTGYWTDIGGRFENQIRATKRLMILVPLALVINFFLLYLNFRKLSLTAVVFFGIPTTLAGGFILLWIAPALSGLLGLETVNLSVAVWVGFIALFGIAVDDGVVIATYINQVMERHKVRSVGEIRERIVKAGLRRIRPALMTTFTTILALIPILLSTGRGADVMKPMAIPSVGGMAISLISLFVVPVAYAGLLEWRWRLGLDHPFFDRPGDGDGPQGGPSNAADPPGGDHELP